MISDMAENQRTLAAAAGVSQTTVSLALRGDPSIPAATRERIRRLAQGAGYRSNPLVAGLMAQIRRRRRVKSGGCIALLVDAANRAEWTGDEIFKKQHEGMHGRAAELGFRTEAFYLRAPGMSAAVIDRVLHARGIRSLVLAGPRRRPVDLTGMRWDDYACATISYTWDFPPVDRVSSHHRHNMDETLRRLAARGCRRIGVSLDATAVASVDHNWLSGVLVWNQAQAVRRRVPLFTGEHTAGGFREFAAWFRRWKPDALVSLTGWEQGWLDELGLRTPGDIGHACVNRPDGSAVAGIEEDHAMIGATVIELLVAQMLRNEYGLPQRPRLTLINGCWREGETLAATVG